MKERQLLVRNFEAGSYLESFLLAAVASVLIIRLFLRLTGYPQIGGGGLHIAHMLWGGVLMLASIIVLLSFLSREARQIAAVAGGVGFGTFIDEVGKFVTSDHDYFFQPAVSMIYVTFILIFLAIRAIHRNRTYTPAEYLANALQEVEQAVLHDFDAEGRKRALLFLRRSDAAHPLAPALHDVLVALDAVRPPTRPGLLVILKQQVRGFYHYVAGLRWFPLLVIGFFTAQLVVKLVYVFIIIFLIGLGWEQILSVRVIGSIGERMLHLSFVAWAEIASSLLSGACVLCGVVLMRRSRLSALKWFERSILVSIFLTQVFAFYQEQFSALLGLFLNVAVLLALRFMIERERAAVIESVATDSI